MKNFKLLFFSSLFLFSTNIIAQKLPEKEICAAAIETLMARNSISKYINTYTENSHKVYVFSSRKNINDKDACYLSGDRVIWRVESGAGISKGRWRTSNYDEKVSFKIEGDQLLIYLTYSDNSKSSSKYSIKKLSGAIK